MLDFRVIDRSLEKQDGGMDCNIENPGSDLFGLNIFKFQMFSNDILNEQIVAKAVTEKTVTNLNLNFKFLFNVKFGSWAFRNCAYFVMKPSGCDTVRFSV